jgi:hypothetical protein
MRTAYLLALTAILAAGPLAAQDEERPRGPVRGGGGMSFIVALPQGEFGQAISAGYGMNLNGHLNLARQGMLRLRVDGGFLQYGSEQTERCFSNTVGCRVRLDVVTSNQIAFANAGPEVVLPLGFVRPYFNAGIGFSYFVTGSHVEGVNSEESIGSTTNLDDGVLAYTGGGGLLFPIELKSGVPLAIDLSARYHHNGVVSYLREGDIRDNPDGTISFEPRRTEANLVTLQLGVTMGIRSRR